MPAKPYHIGELTYSRVHIGRREQERAYSLEDIVFQRVVPGIQPPDPPRRVFVSTKGLGEGLFETWWLSPKDWRDGSTPSRKYEYRVISGLVPLPEVEWIEIDDSDIPTEGDRLGNLGGMADVEYKLHVRAKTDGGISATVIATLAPGPPQGVFVRVYERGISTPEGTFIAAFSAAEKWGDAIESSRGYEYRSVAIPDTAGPWSEIAESARPTFVNPLRNLGGIGGTQYKLEVRSKTDAGVSEIVASNIVTTPLTEGAPGKPTFVQPRSFGVESASRGYAWGPPDSWGTGTVESRRYEYRHLEGTAISSVNTSTSGVAWTEVPISVTSAVFHNLKRGIIWTFQVRAKTSVGPGPPLNEGGFITRASSIEPRNLRLRALPGGTSYRASWLAPSIWRSLESGMFEWRNGTSGAWTEVGGRVLSVDVTGLQPSTLYTFQIRALRGSVVSDTISDTVTTLVRINLPSAPQNLSFTGGFRTIDLSWEAPASSGDRGIDGYRVYRSEDGSDYSLVSRSQRELTYRDSTRSFGQFIWYRVVAVSGGAEGAAAAIVGRSGRLVASASLDRSYESEFLTTTHGEADEFSIIAGVLYVGYSSVSDAQHMGAVSSGWYFWFTQGRTQYVFRITSGPTSGMVQRTGVKYVSFGLETIGPDWTRTSDDNTVRSLSFGRIRTTRG